MIRSGRRRAALIGGLVFVTVLGAWVYGTLEQFELSDDLFPRVPPGHLAVLIAKSGRTPPAGSIIAPRVEDGEEPYRGVQEDVLAPGWYPTGYDPYRWDWQIVPQTVIPPSSVGVRVRLFGEDLPPGRVLADEDPADEARGIRRKGVLSDTLEPGTHLINPFAYDVLVVPLVHIESGQVGVVTRRAGATPRDPDAFLSGEGERGVQAVTLPPGSHYVNPFLIDVLPVSRQSQRLDLASVGRGVRFATQDGFEIGLNGTVEWSLPEASVPGIYVRFGSTEETQRKLMLPAAQAISQTLGTLKPAREFITGATRLSFQNDFESDLRAVIEREGPQVQSALISSIMPPGKLAELIKKRENSENLREQYEKQINAERARAELVKQAEAEDRPQALAQMEVQNVQTAKLAEVRRQKRITEAETELEKTRLQREMADRHVEKLRVNAEADHEILRRKNEIDFELLSRRIATHGSSMAYAEAVLMEKLAPRYSKIEAGAEGPLARVFAGPDGQGDDNEEESK